MGYDAIRDLHPSPGGNPTTPSPTANKPSISMLLNTDSIPPSPSSSRPGARYDPVHHPDLPSPVEMASISGPRHGYFAPASPSREDSSHAASGLGLNVRPAAGPLLGVQPSTSRAPTTSPTISAGPLSSVSLSPRASPSRASLSRPTSSRSMPPPPPVPIPYKPKERISPPKSVLIPITAEELHRLAESHKNPLRKSIPLVATQLDHLLDTSWQPQTDASDSGAWSPSRDNENLSSSIQYSQSPSTSFAEPSSSSPAADAAAAARKRAASNTSDGASEEWGRMLHPSLRQNEQIVAQHYNARPEVGKDARDQSPIIGLKSFNNWIKAVMIAKFARPPVRETNSRPEGLEFVGSRRRPKCTARVLDLGCGKGGDLGKWAKAEIALYVGVDIADVSINQARERWATQRRKAFDAEFYALDCFSKRLNDHLPPGVLQPFDVVSLQFCMHYAFETEEKVRTMMENVASSLRPGGVFIGTIPNARSLLRRLKKIPDGDPLTFGNSVYSIRFETRQSPDKSPYGHKYWFWLQDAVDAPEYIVKWDPFVELAASYGLELVYKEDFHTIYEKEQEPLEFRQLLSAMKVVDSKGESALDQDQWDAANIYIGFAFRMTRPSNGQ